MPFECDGCAEAYASVALLVAGSDDVGTLTERQFLFEQLTELDVFSGMDNEAVGSLLGATTGRMFAELPADGGALSADAVSDICAGARAVLSQAQCLELFRMAADLACCDGLVDSERDLLVRVADGLDLDADSAQQIIIGAAAG